MGGVLGKKDCLFRQPFCYILAMLMKAQHLRLL